VRGHRHNFADDDGVVSGLVLGPYLTVQPRHGVTEARSGRARCPGSEAEPVDVAPGESAGEFRVRVGHDVDAEIAAVTDEWPRRRGVRDAERHHRGCSDTEVKELQAMPTGPPWNSAAMITTPVGYSAITRRNPAAGSCSVEAILGGPRAPDHPASPVALPTRAAPGHLIAPVLHN
jgi:hypothetical protein